MTNLEDNIKNLTPIEFELQAKGLLSGLEKKILNLEIIHNSIEKAPDGQYQIDIKVTYEFLGVNFIILVECKRYESNIKRETVQILKEKISSLGAQKGIIISTSEFQKGAIEYAKSHGIALVRIASGGLEYQTKSMFAKMDNPFKPIKKQFSFYWIKEEENSNISTTYLNSDYLKEFSHSLINNQ